MKTLLISGAAGFIGRAACARFKGKYQIVAVDDLSRPSARPPEGVLFLRGDCVDGFPPGSGFDAIIHLAAQVSVVKSLIDPRADFKNNASKTMQLALSASRMRPYPVFIYANTNKVYGELRGQKCPVRDDQPIRPETPYGISKAAGGMYVRDLLPDSGFDFRMSCIYGEDQIGSEDQGWIGYLRRKIRSGEPIRCFGDGTQVRDLLHVEDLLNAYELALDGIIPPGSYAVGGGGRNAVSFREAVELLGGKIGSYGDWRPRDQRYFIAAADGLRLAGWRPNVDAREWLKRHGKDVSSGVFANPKAI